MKQLLIRLIRHFDLVPHTEITVTYRGDGYVAHVASRPGTWAFGLNQDEAVGNLVRSHPERTNTVIRYLPESYDSQ